MCFFLAKLYRFLTAQATPQSPAQSSAEPLLGSMHGPSQWRVEGGFRRTEGFHSTWLAFEASLACTGESAMPVCGSFSLSRESAGPSNACLTVGPVVKPKLPKLHARWSWKSSVLALSS